MGERGRRIMFYLFDNSLSLKAKGLLAILLNLPENKTPTQELLMGLVTDGRVAIKSTIKELKTKGYLTITRKKSVVGFAYDWKPIENKNENQN